MMAKPHGRADDDAPVFPSRKAGGHLNRSQVLRIVQQATRRAGIRRNVSPHWFRHAHASHAMDRGAGIHLVPATLGHSSISVTGRYLHTKPNESFRDIPGRVRPTARRLAAVEVNGGKDVNLES